MPVYQAENTLQRAIDSIYAQTFKNWELIIVDDGSKDQSGNIAQINARNDPRIKVIQKKDNEGLSQARNTGLAVAQNEYITFVDSDDWIEPEELQKGYEKAKSQNFDIVVWGIIQDIEDIYGNVKASTILLAEPEIYCGLEEVIKGIAVLDYKKIFPYTCNKLYRRKQISGILFENIPLIEDSLFNLQAFLRSQKIGVVNNGYYHYLQSSSGSLSSKYIKNYYELMKQRLHNIEYVCGQGKLDNSTWGLIYSTYNRILFSTMRRFWLPGNEMHLFRRMESVNKILRDPETAKSIKKSIPKSFKDYIFKILLMSKCGILNLGFSWLLYILGSKLPGMFYKLK